MPNRYSIVVKLDGETKIAQYGHDMGNPKWAGTDVLDFLKETSMEGFKRMLRDTVSYTPKEEDQDHNTVLYDDDVLGVRVLTEVMEGRMSRIPLDIWYGTSIFCSWLYIIDLDAMTFMVRKGAVANYHLYKLPTLKKYLIDCGDTYS